jgi:hypothetical protein
MDHSDSREKERAGQGRTSSGRDSFWPALFPWAGAARLLHEEQLLDNLEVTRIDAIEVDTG